MDFVLSILLGVGLAGAVGFRVFVPFLIMGLAQQFGWMELSEGFAWMGSWPAIALFGVATTLEIGAYFIPWLDNVLDTVTTPLAVLGGTVLMSAAIIEFDPMLQWTLAIIAGGGTAGIVKGSNATTRVASTASTGGLANPLVAATELGSSIFLTITSFLWPAVIGTVVLVILLLLIFFVRKIRRSRTTT